MAAFTSAEDELEFSYQPEDDEEYVGLPCGESTEQQQEEEEEEYASLPTHGSAQQEEEGMDEEQQVLCEVLCADRVGQMTRTYSDIDAVTRLLEEKERDLELAAHIGQSLLKKNKALSERNELLEEQVEHIREEVSQLRHDLSMKDELLQFYTSAAEESEVASAASTPLRPSETNQSLPTFFPLDCLQKKLKDLEEENKSLRFEASHLETETVSYEEKEQQLVNDCVKQLRDANVQISSLAEELARKAEDASRQQEEIRHLLSQIVDLQRKAKLYAVENEELTQHLGAAKDAQRQLTAELQELQDKYAECMEMLHEAQEELKNLRNKTQPLSSSRRFHSLGLFPMDSLAAEIEGTMRKELQMDDPDVEEQRLHPKRVFQTVKNLNLLRQQRSSLAPSPLNIPGSNQTSCFTSGRSSRVGTPRANSIYGSDTGSGIFLDNRTSILESLESDGSEDSNKRPPGTPGTPGSRDLEAALRRLSLRRDNYLSEKRFFEEERERKLAYLSKEDEKGGGQSSGGPSTPTESLLSLCSHPSLGSVWSGYSFTARSYLPEKLQIVKPLEGDYLSRGSQASSASHEEKENQNPKHLHNESEIFQLKQQNLSQKDAQNSTGNPNTPPDTGTIYLQVQNHNQQESQCLILHSKSKICPSTSQDPKNLQRSSSVLELSSLPGLRAPLAAVTGSATLHAWQQLAQPHMGAVLDHRPGVVTKGFRTLAHELEQEDNWQLDQPEEDEASCDPFSSFTGESSAALDLPHATSTPSVRCVRIADDKGLSETLCGAKDGRVANAGSSLCCERMNGHVDLKELQAAQPVDHMPVIFPGKCMSHTSSTYTFTTCRILHPSDQLTSVSPSSAAASCQSSVYVGSTTPASTPVALSAPHTPSCTPRRLSLSLPLAESSTNLRDSTKTTSTSLGLVRLLLEHGISASVYNPGSWDRGMNVSVAPVDGHFLRRPDTLLLPPSTPPNSPHSKSSTSTATQPVFQFSPSPDDPPYYNAFLASKPARTILREVLGEAEKERAAQTDDEVLNLRLVDKLKRFRTLSPHSASVSSGTNLFGTTGLGSGLPGLNPGLRRNRTYPALVGASMAMKDPGGPASTDILIQHPTPNTQHTETSKTHRKCSIHIPQTLHALETVTPQTIVQRHARDSTSSEEEPVP